MILRMRVLMMIREKIGTPSRRMRSEVCDPKLQRSPSLPLPLFPLFHIFVLQTPFPPSIAPPSPLHKPRRPPRPSSSFLILFLHPEFANTLSPILNRLAPFLPSFGLGYRETGRRGLGECRAEGVAKISILTVPADDERRKGGDKEDRGSKSKRR